MAETSTFKLRLTEEDAGELRRALEKTHGDILRDLAALMDCGHSPTGIDLCRRKSRVERLIDSLDPSHEIHALAESAVREMGLRVAA